MRLFMLLVGPFESNRFFAGRAVLWRPTGKGVIASLRVLYHREESWQSSIRKQELNVFFYGNTTNERSFSVLFEFV